jgi:type IV fimbrial biogenesis protein FimT
MRSTSPGFTLIELLVALLIAGILTGLAVPAFNSFILNDRDIGQINSLVSSLNYARSEAIKQNLPGGITVCPSLNGTSCSGTVWSGGVIVTDGLGGPPYQSIPAFAGSNTVTPTGGTTGITFTSNGAVTPSQLTTITVCDTRGATFARELEVNATGRVAASQKAGFTLAQVALTCPP